MKKYFQYISIHHAVESLLSLQKAEALIKYFYYLLFFLGFMEITIQGGIFNKTNFSPIYPLFWVQNLPLITITQIIFVFFILTSLLGCLFYNARWARILAFLGILQLHSFFISFAGQYHPWDPWLYISFFFIFLPNWDDIEKETVEEKKKFLFTIWGAQAFFLLTYTMAGLGKIVGAIEQISLGEVHAFLPEAMALQIANNLNNFHTQTLFGSFFILNPLVGWPLYIGSIFLELFSFIIVFYPSFHKLWACFLLGMHICIYLILGVVVNPIVLLLILLFFNSPFAVKTQSLIP